MSKRVIKGWEDLVGLENDNYYLDIELRGGCGWICSKKDTDDWKEYLSTHTFYGSQYKQMTILLQQYGFDVQLENWDGPTEDVDYRDQWLYRGICKDCRKYKYCSKPCTAHKRSTERFLSSAIHGIMDEVSGGAYSKIMENSSYR